MLYSRHSFRLWLRWVAVNVAACFVATLVGAGLFSVYTAIALALLPAKPSYPALGTAIQVMVLTLAYLGSLLFVLPLIGALAGAIIGLGQYAVLRQVLPQLRHWKTHVAGCGSVAIPIAVVLWFLLQRIHHLPGGVIAVVIGIVSGLIVGAMQRRTIWQVARFSATRWLVMTCVGIVLGHLGGMAGISIADMAAGILAAPYLHLVLRVICAGLVGAALYSMVTALVLPTLLHDVSAFAPGEPEVE